MKSIALIPSFSPGRSSSQAVIARHASRGESNTPLEMASIFRVAVACRLILLRPSKLTPVARAACRKIASLAPARASISLMPALLRWRFWILLISGRSERSFEAVARSMQCS
ncbi:MAG: hypothetical protein COZ70_02910 [Deltaproteobacteria bacterium CG_4_8_14_3_um_filter_51_11]|nr:MAG: hypothetical protein COZ70_02910 [Deltaproteobacteria bacterium CG_4_8_14_3_um_filter_51_11]